MQTLKGNDESEIHLYQEIGINWKRIDTPNNWKHRTKKLKGSSASTEAKKLLPDIYLNICSLLRRSREAKKYCRP